MSGSASISLVARTHKAQFLLNNLANQFQGEINAVDHHPATICRHQTEIKCNQFPNLNASKAIVVKVSAIGLSEQDVWGGPLDKPNADGLQVAWDELQRNQLVPWQISVRTGTDAAEEHYRHHQYIHGTWPGGGITGKSGFPGVTPKFSGNGILKGYSKAFVFACGVACGEAPGVKGGTR
jgi:hypothetical protein